MAKQPAKRPAKKKTASAPRKKAAAGKAAGQRSSPPPPGRGKNPVYVLVIMGLVTVLALMFADYYGIKGPAGVKQPEETAAPMTGREPRDDEAKDGVKEKKEERRHKETVEEKTARPVEASDPQPKQQSESVRIYFVAHNEKTDKLYLSPVTRTVKKQPLLENTLRELVRGPTAAEKKKGLLTAVPPGLRINSVRVRNRTAEIDFSSAIEYGASGSILLNRLDQIVYTATQFSNVESVIIKINGKTRQTLGADGLSISGPLHRRQ